jgi:hypothetical protein
MYIELDLSVVPPISSLRDADDLERLTVVANRPSHVFVGWRSFADWRASGATTLNGRPSWRG